MSVDAHDEKLQLHQAAAGSGWLTTWAPLGIAVAQAGVLLAMGRRWWCACGEWFIGTNHPADEHTSQHLLDPYSWSHLQHGLALWPLLAWLAPQRSARWRVAVAMAIEAGWELLENSPWVIDRYRTVTAATDYPGDTIINSLCDLGCCVAGLAVAAKLGWKRTLALFFVIELATIVVYRDSLLMNVLMLLAPVDAISEWQQASWQNS